MSQINISANEEVKFPSECALHTHMPYSYLLYSYREKLLL